MSGLIILMVFISLTGWVLALAYYRIYFLHRQRLLKALGVKGCQKAINVTMGEKITQAGKLLEPLGKRIYPVFKRAGLEKNLVLAGYPLGLSLNGLAGFSFILAAVGVILGNLLVIIGFPMAGLLQLLLFLCGFLGPAVWLRNTAHRRQERIGLDLPDYLDAVSVALSAGVPLETALHYIIRETEGPLGEELMLLLKETELGIPREEAYIRMVQRNNCPQLTAMAESLIRGNKLGVPVSDTFRLLAEGFRAERIYRIKDKAGQASPKVTLITSFIILPALLLGIFGLLALNLIYNPQSLGLNRIFS